MCICMYVCIYIYIYVCYNVNMYNIYIYIYTYVMTRLVPWLELPAAPGLTAQSMVWPDGSAP